jgi:hypothetical protein
MRPAATSGTSTTTVAGTSCSASSGSFGSTTPVYLSITHATKLKNRLILIDQGRECGGGSVDSHSHGGDTRKSGPHESDLS